MAKKRVTGLGTSSRPRPTAALRARRRWRSGARATRRTARSRGALQLEQFGCANYTWLSVQFWLYNFRCTSVLKLRVLQVVSSTDFRRVLVSGPRSLSPGARRPAGGLRVGPLDRLRLLLGDLRRRRGEAHAPEGGRGERSCSQVLVSSQVPVNVSTVCLGCTFLYLSVFWGLHSASRSLVVHPLSGPVRPCSGRGERRRRGVRGLRRADPRLRAPELPDRVRVVTESARACSSHSVFAGSISGSSWLCQFWLHQFWL